VRFVVDERLLADLASSAIDSLWLGSAHDQYAFRRLISPALFASMRDDLIPQPSPPR